MREDLHYYSVPYYLYKKEPKTKVRMVYDDRIVALYYDNMRIAQHKRDRTPNAYSTVLPQTELELFSTIPDHENIRGSKYYN